MLNSKTIGIIIGIGIVVGLGKWLYSEKSKQEQLRTVAVNEIKLKRQTAFDLYFSGQRELYRFKTHEINEQNTYARASYFLIYGSGEYKSENKQTIIIQFMWKDMNDNFVKSKIEPDKIRFKIDETIKIPLIEFAYQQEPLQSGYNLFPNAEPPRWLANIDYLKFLNENPAISVAFFVKYVTITCSSNDLPPEINLN